MAQGAQGADFHARQQLAVVARGLVEFRVMVEVPVGVEVVDEEEERLPFVALQPADGQGEPEPALVEAVDPGDPAHHRQGGREGREA